MIDKLAARFVAVADEDLSAAYDMGVQDSMLRAEQYKRILADLIAELRGSVTYYSHGGCDLRDRHMLERVSRAEARLREVQGE